MKQKLLLICLLISTIVIAQDTERKILRGKVIYRNVNVVGVNVVNNTTSKGTATNAKGEYEILAKEGDILIFSSVQYTIREITITNKVLKNNRLVVEVKEKIEELDAAVISPENKEKFLDFQEEQIAKYKDYQFADDRYSKVHNEALDQANFQGANILGLVGMLLNTIIGEGKKREVEKPIHLRTSFNDIRDRYKNEFFTKNLNIPEEKIAAFLYYCDDQLPSEDIFTKKNEFLMIDFMVKNSKTFLESLKTKE
ncbi:carboxypeptidase-like regulatory domain-containing protein [uncultured Kordia sp.]|uniref:carboxypeptidase-like regulatory domain-containing protein n=1 Tax=uncultured Kordia sp. TaxID=507699 RepID=UPI00262606F5|nr:carboxypeptidase-like regulatory domain-containing protein [uncultured Kordia sp.]